MRCLNICDMETQMAGKIERNWERIYVGSYFCANYFVGIDVTRVRELVGDEVQVTLVVPILNQRNLATGKEKVKEFINILGTQLDEISVNEYGLLDFVYHHADCNINMGRLLLKDNRDPRVDEFYHRCAKPKLFTNMFVDMLKKYKVTCVELDEIFETIHVTELPKDVEVGIHIPYMYISTGHICEIASNGKSDDKKFRPGDSCAHTCKDFHISYNDETLSYVKLGRGIYVKRDVRANIITENQIRVIYMPL